MATDLLSLLGVVGTWIAVFLAVIALVGIVAPLLVLKAFYSERNQALNSVRDLNGDFISRGIGFGRSFRVFHRVNVPCLIPIIDWKSLDSFKIPSPEKSWKLGTVEGTSCRTGWARFCKLLSAYHVPLTQGGELVVRENETSLPVSKYYILSIGLLGRYGDRDDGGKFFNDNPLRPDLLQLRILTTFRGPQRMGRRYRSSSGSDISNTDSETDDSSIHRTRRPQARSICGTTGEMRIKKEFSLADIAEEENGFGVTGNGKTLQFMLHNDQEIGLDIEPGEATDTMHPLVAPDLPLDNLYWLASGFIPLSSRYGFVACLQTPQGILDLESTRSLFSDTDSDSRSSPNHRTSSNRSVRSRKPSPSSSSRSGHSNLNYRGYGTKIKNIQPRGSTRNKTTNLLNNWTTLELDETFERPISIDETITAFGMSSTRILMFHSTTKKVSRDPNEVSHLKSLILHDIHSGTSNWIMWKARHGSQKTPVFLRRCDVQMLVYEMLKIVWHPWSFLIWRLNNGFWNHMMRAGGRCLNGSDIQTLLKTWKKYPQEWEKPWAKLLKEWLQFSGGKSSKYKQKRHNALLELHNALKRTVGNINSAHVIAVLFISNDDFRKRALDKDRAELVAELDTEKRTVLLVGTTRASDSEEHAEDMIGETSNVENESRGGKENVNLQSKRSLSEGAIYQYEDIFSLKDEALSVEKIIKVGPEDLFVAVTWAATCCALWASSIDSEPLMRMVDGLGDIVNVV